MWRRILRLLSGMMLSVSIVTPILAADVYFFVSHAGVADPFWRIQFKGASEAATESGMDLRILSPETVNDFGRQIELLVSAVAAGAAGIATTVTEPYGFAPVLAKAHAAGIPVIAFNARPEDDDRRRNPYLAYVGMDDYRAGRVLARHALRRGRLAAPVVVAIQQAGHAGLEARLKGIVEVLSEEDIVVERLNVRSNDDATERLFRDYLATHGPVGTVITLGPEAAHPIGRVIRAEGLAPYMAGFDLSSLTVRMIEDGVMDFVVDQQPYMQGYLAVKLLRLAAAYRMTPPDIDTGIGIVDAATVGTVVQLAREHIR